jgi:hemolysin activation/secretion protein
VGDYSDEPDQTLQSVGIGLRYSVTDYLDLRFAYGWNVGDSGILDAPEGHMHFGATVKF